MSVIEKMLDSWTALFKGILIFIFILSSLYFFLVNLFNNVGFNSISVSTQDGISINFDKLTNYRSVIVQPRSWQATDIRVNAGDEITLDAYGGINIAMGRMVKSLEFQYKVKEKNEKMGLGRDVDSFTKEEVEGSLFAYPWNGPEGIDLKNIHLDSAVDRIRESQQKRVYPKANVGQLLVVISPSLSNEFPNLDKSQIFPYGGKGSKFIVENEGYIWFIVNDLMPDADPLKREVDWQDNLGLFDVKILINRKK